MVLVGGYVPSVILFIITRKELWEERFSDVRCMKSKRDPSKLETSMVFEDHPLWNNK
jgi:hypothetical protein